jgi:hypothetical protein
MSYTYHGKDVYIKTGELITVFPSGLIQKKITVVKRLPAKNSLATLDQATADAQLKDGFSAFPLPSAKDLYNGFMQFDIVGYKTNLGDANGVINYKYRKLSSYIEVDQYDPKSVEVFVEVGVRSTVVSSAGVETKTNNTSGDTRTQITYQEPDQYNGSLNAYDRNGGIFTELLKTEFFIVFIDEIRFTTTLNVKYTPTIVLDSVSSTYYGKFTEYITTNSVKIIRTILSQSTIEG